jgi:CubicO group peptidase (beta-lactamase class C family)
MRRREFITLAGSTAIAWPPAAPELICGGKKARILIIASALVLVGALLSAPAQADFGTPAVCSATFPFGQAEPTRQGVDPQKLLEMTQWLRDGPAPVLSVTISRRGKIVYELYSSKVDRNDAHYLMSVTKSVTSALVGAAIDRQLVKSAGRSVTASLPASVFPSTESLDRFEGITLKNVLGMSALDAPVSPHLKTPEAIDRGRKFFFSSNRLTFALEQAVLVHLGVDFQYTDITPLLAAGIVQYAARQSLLDFGKKTLFGAMDFQNEEWMHQDRAGIDNASYGLRLRPLDMQKFGILYLNQGCWDGQQLLPKDWVATSFLPWIKSRPGLREPNYGWYWWQDRFASGWIGHSAKGWKGQRITVVPDRQLVVTMTAIVEDDGDDRLYFELFNRFIIPAVDGKRRAGPDANLDARLKLGLNEVWTGKNAISPNTQPRMIPSSRPKELHREFRP